LNGLNPYSGSHEGGSSLNRHLQLTKLTTVQSPVQKRQAAPVLPASLETFVAAIELLAERRRSCEVGLIGAGEGDTSFGTHTLASFPTHDPRKRKTIARAWMRKENRPRRVVIAEICSGDKIAYGCFVSKKRASAFARTVAYSCIRQ